MRVLGPKAIEQLKADHRKLARWHPSIGGESAARNFSGNDLRVATVETLTSPSSSAVAPTTCKCALLRLDPVTKVLTPTNQRLLCYNFTAGNNAAKGTYARVRFDGVWEIYWLACSATAAWSTLSADPEPDPEPDPEVP